jgi:hypothetical protein
MPSSLVIQFAGSKTKASGQSRRKTGPWIDCIPSIGATQLFAIGMPTGIHSHFSDSVQAQPVLAQLVHNESAHVAPISPCHGSKAP